MVGSCINEEQEWVLKTCYSRTDRLPKAGVSNKHAGIQGMPAVTEEEKTLIMMTILALKTLELHKAKRSIRTGQVVDQKGSTALFEIQSAHRGHGRQTW